ncbi:hypothetical protein B0H19DRAFT_696314 [Mycena capillaripes]|nr:hypothetical protein B0H19DRAFT_696314 [Mycena capillaripes]
MRLQMVSRSLSKPRRTVGELPRQLQLRLLAAAPRHLEAWVHRHLDRQRLANRPSQRQLPPRRSVHRQQLNRPPVDLLRSRILVRLSGQVQAVVLLLRPQAQVASPLLLASHLYSARILQQLVAPSLGSLHLGPQPRLPNLRSVLPPHQRLNLRLGLPPQPPSSEHLRDLVHSLNPPPNRLLSALEGQCFRIMPMVGRSGTVPRMRTCQSLHLDSRRQIHPLPSPLLALLPNRPYSGSHLLALPLQQPNLLSVLPPVPRPNLRSVLPSLPPSLLLVLPPFQQLNLHSVLPPFQPLNPRSVPPPQPPPLEHLLVLARPLSQLLANPQPLAMEAQCLRITQAEVRLVATHLMPTRPSRHLDSRRPIHRPHSRPLEERNRPFLDNQRRPPSATLLSSRPPLSATQRNSQPLHSATQRSRRPPLSATQRSSQPLRSVTQLSSQCLHSAPPNPNRLSLRIRALRRNPPRPTSKTRK